MLADKLVFDLTQLSKVCLNYSPELLKLSFAKICLSAERVEACRISASVM